MLIKSLKRLRGIVFPVLFILGPLLFVGASEMNNDTPTADDLAAEINKLLKAELEKEFGPLNDEIEYDETEMYGRVIGINYELTEGRRLDDTWGNKVVTALSRLGITATNEGDEVRAEGQEIAGKEALSMQLTTSRGLDEPDVIGFVAMFPGNS